MLQRFLIFVGCALLVTALSALAAIFLSPIGYLGLWIYYGWVAFAFFHYRQVRQQEVLHLLTTAVTTQAPLAPALEAYLADRPHSFWRELWVCIMLFFIVPIILPFIYLTIVFATGRRPGFDQKVHWVAELLRQGCSLHAALRAVPGVVSQETLLAVAVGQQTGKLEQCLQKVPRQRFGSSVTETLPGLLYPLTLLPIIFGVFTFQMIFVVPKFEKIFSDFKMRLPPITTLFIDIGHGLFRNAWWPFLCVVALTLFAALVYSSGTVRWYLPIFGGLYRMRVQARLLSMLSVLLDAGKTLPDALETLMHTGYFPWIVQKRLALVRAAIERGEPLPASMQKQRLLPRNMGPLLSAAERSRNLVWVLGEMGVTLSNRLIRVSQRVVGVLFPVAMFSVGVVVGLYAIAMFLPLVEILNQLTELC